MSDDFEPIEAEDFEDIQSSVTDTKGRPDGAFDMIAGVVNKIPWKVALFIFILFILITSRDFVEYVLGRFDGTVDHCEPNLKGTMIQGLLLSLGMIAVSTLVDAQIL